MKRTFMRCFYGAWAAVIAYRMLDYRWRIYKFPSVINDVRCMYELARAMENGELDEEIKEINLAVSEFEEGA